MFRVFKQMNIRNRAYVIDSKGNKVFYGTVYQCNKFISYMENETIIYKGGSENGTDEPRITSQRENRD